MSHNGNAVGGEATCANCGREFGNAGARATHEQACEGGSDAEAETPENSGFRASDMKIDEIEGAVKGADADTLDATLALHGHEPMDADTRESAAAKALITEKSGGREAYTTVFGECPHDGCGYGRNGFRATTCKRHGGADTDTHEPESGGESGESSPETAENGKSANTDTHEPPRADGEAELMASLIKKGVPPEQAAEAAEVRFA